MERYQHIPEHLAAEVEAYQQGTMGQDLTERTMPRSQVYTGAISYTVGDESAVQSGSRATYSHSYAGVSGGSVAATLQRMGSSQTVELIPGDPSSRTQVEMAIKEGLLVRDPSGQYRDAGTMQSAVNDLANPKAEPEMTDPGRGVFAPREDDAWNEAIAPIPQHAYDAGVASIIGSLATGIADHQGAADRLARSSNMEPAQAAQVLAQGMAYYKGTLDRALGQTGMDGANIEAFYEHLRSANQGGLQDAAQHFVLLRDASKFMTLAKEWSDRNGLKSLAGADMSKLAAQQQAATGQRNPLAHELALNRKGMETRTSASGEMMIRTPGGQWRSLSEVATYEPVKMVVDTRTGEMADEASLKAGDDFDIFWREKL